MVRILSSLMKNSLVERLMEGVVKAQTSYLRPVVIPAKQLFILSVISSVSLPRAIVLCNFDTQKYEKTHTNQHIHAFFSHCVTACSTHPHSPAVVLSCHDKKTTLSTL